MNECVDRKPHREMGEFGLIVGNEGSKKRPDKTCTDDDDLLMVGTERKSMIFLSFYKWETTRKTTHASPGGLDVEKVISRCVLVKVSVLADETP